MKTLLLTLTFSILFSTQAFANMGALLIIPKDPQPVISIQIGGMRSSTDIDKSSVGPALDNGSFEFTESAPFIGGLIGLQNSFYRFSLSYDYTNGSDIDMERFLMNFDFKIGTEGGFRWLLGTGVGVAQSSYELDNRSLKQSNGILSFRGGTEYVLSEKSSLEFIVEYSYSLNSSSSKSYYDENNFTSYEIEDQNGIIMRVGYSFWFWSKKHSDTFKQPIIDNGLFNP